MRLGDIFPRKDIVLVLGDREYKILPPSMETLARIEQWYETATGQKKRWNEIFQDTTALSIADFVDFMKIVIDASNEETPTRDALMKKINTANYAQCITAVARALTDSMPEETEQSSSSKSDGPVDWRDILQFACMEKGLKWEEVRSMTIRELDALLVPSNKLKKEVVKEEKPQVPLDTRFEIVDGIRPRWLVDAMQNARDKGIETNPDIIKHKIVSKVLAAM
jgi:hypothetical protein